jgi:PAS domain-containing protein
MADKNWQAGGRILIPAWAVVCAAVAVVPSASAWAASGDFAPPSYVGSADPNMIWELLIGGVVIASFLGAIALWVHSALRKVKRAQLRKNAFVSSALNNLSQGVVMTDAQKRIMFCNDRYLEIYGLTRSDVPRSMTEPELLELRRERGLLDLSDEEFQAKAATPEGVITELPDGRSVVARQFPLPNGGTVATHEDCSEQRKLSRQLASTKQFLESVLDNVPVCVAAKNIDDGRYIFANRAFERFSRFSRDHIVGKCAEEIFRPETTASIQAADQAALNSPDGRFTTNS